MGDGEFIKACEIPDEPFLVGIALAARRIIAEPGTVPAETIRPDDTFAHDLVQLPFWDSLEWMGLVLGIEGELGSRVNITEDCFDEAMRAARSEALDLRVRHIVLGGGVGGHVRSDGGEFVPRFGVGDGTTDRT